MATQIFPPQTKAAKVSLPWGAKIDVEISEAIGREIFNQRIFDIGLSELAWRVVAPGARVLDVGANIGYFSSLLAARCRREGVVHAFEPHPVIHETLRRNVAPQNLAPTAGKVILHACALGGAKGEARLIETDYFGINHGTARIAEHSGEAELRVHSVPMETLDGLFPSDSFDLMKIDVEGFETRVLEGAASLLREKRIRNIVYEDHEWRQGGLAEIFRKRGYSVFAVGYDFWGPRLQEAGEKICINEGWESPNFLASLDGDAALKAAEPRGWRVLSNR